MRDLLRRALEWRGGGAPGVYVTRVAVAGQITVGALAGEPWVESAVLRDGYLTVTITRAALEQVAHDVAEAGPACLTSDILTRTTVPANPASDLTTVRNWADAHRLLHAELKTTLSVAAGATEGPPQTPVQAKEGSACRYDIQEAIAYAGEDMVRFWLARTAAEPARPPDVGGLARHVLGNPAYAVLYAHAAAVAVLRWAGSPPGEFRPGRPARPGEFLLLDALSWLPERVATAARRGQPELFARYLEMLASRTIDIMSTSGLHAGMDPELARAARTALAAGLGLLGIAAPERT